MSALSTRAVVAIAAVGAGAALAVYLLRRKEPATGSQSGAAAKRAVRRKPAPVQVLGFPSAKRWQPQLRGDEAAAAELVAGGDKKDVRLCGDLVGLLAAAAGPGRSAEATAAAKAALQLFGALLEPARKLAKEELDDQRDGLYAVLAKLLAQDCDAELANCVLSVAVDLTKEKRKQFSKTGEPHPPCVELLTSILAALAQHEGDRGVAGRACRCLSFIFVEPENRDCGLGQRAIARVVSAMRQEETGNYVEGCSALKSLARSPELCEVIVRDEGLAAVLRAMRVRPEIAEVQWRAIECMFYLVQNGQRAAVLAPGAQAVELVEACAKRFGNYQRPARAALQFWSTVLGDAQVKAKVDLKRVQEICSSRKYPHDQERFAYAQKVRELL